MEGICKICNLRTYDGQLFYKEEEGGPEQCMEGPFTLFLASNVSHISTTTHLTPRALIGDGKLDLMIVKEIGRCALLSLFLDLESGSHVESPHVTHQKVSSFRLVPGVCNDGCCCLWSMFCRCCCQPVSKDTGVCVIDGEVVPYVSFEASVLPGRVNVLTLPYAPW